jgi:hypothetical protein
MSAEQRARDLLQRLGVNHAPSMTKGDLAELVQVLEERDQLRAALKAVTDSWFVEVEKRLDDLSIVIATSPDPAYAERAKREYHRIHDHEGLRIAGFMKLADDDE